MTMSRHGGEHERLAPVIPLFGGADAAASAPADDLHRPGGTPAAVTWHPTWTDEPVQIAGESDAADVVADAEAALVKRLRTRSLSEREASRFLRERELDEPAIEHVLTRLRGLGYLDDAALAEQMVHSGVERKGQGRTMLVQSLSARGIPRDVIDAALDALPDDDAERALEFARSKARAMRDLDRDTALRRLSGQLARRGYGATAVSAARQALDELGRVSRRPASGTVRFE